MITFERIKINLLKNKALQNSEMIISEFWEDGGRNGDYLGRDFLKAPGEMPVISLNAA